MDRSTKDAWLSGGDLREADVDDVPVKGQSVRVRGLSAKYAADMQAHIKIETQGREQVAEVDAAAMELLQFVHGVIDPEFSEDEARHVQVSYGPAFKKVIAKIEELSDIDADAVEQARATFQGERGGETGKDVGSGDTPAGGSGPDVPARASA